MKSSLPSSAIGYRPSAIPRHRRDAPQPGAYRRSFNIDRAKAIIDEASRTIEVSFSSEEPVERYWGIEILDHSPKACDLSRLNTRGPVLMDHSGHDQVGVIEKAWLDKDAVKHRAKLRFGQSARAKEIWQDILDGIRSNVSVTYNIEEIVLESQTDGQNTYRVRKWCPSEISIVAIPADTTVGVGRAEVPSPIPHSPSPISQTPLIMNRAQMLAALNRAGVSYSPTATDDQLRELLETTLTAAGSARGGVPGSQTAPAAPPITAQRSAGDEGAHVTTALAAERNRVRDITKLYADHNVREIDPDGAVLAEYTGKDLSVDRFQNWILTHRYIAKPLHLDPRVHGDPVANPENQRGPGQKPTPDGYPPRRGNGLGDLLVNSEAYRAIIKTGGNKRALTLDLPTMMHRLTMSRATLGTGALTSYERPPEIILQEQQPLTIAQLFSQGETTREVIRAFRETSYTNAATSVAEEGLKPEATFALEEADFPVEKISVVGRVTDEMFADFPQTRDYVNSRLLFMVLSKLDNLLLNGDGATPNIRGVLNTSGIQTVASGASATIADAMHRALTKIRAIGFFEPDYFVMNPFDWENIALTKDANGQYYGGGPFMGAYGVGDFSIAGRLWGKPVVASTAAAQGVAIAGAFRLGGQHWHREGVRIDTTNSDASDFQYNRIAIRVEQRCALAVYRPLAFCTITGLPATL